MCKSEIHKLQWDGMDLNAEVIWLWPEDTKAQEWRIIPLTEELSETLKNATIYLDAAGHRVPMGSPLSESVSNQCDGHLKWRVVR